ncbi:MAG TPA: divergent polysaccharide deacetylase family protein [Spirochaetota bacterium]|nr:divergent polysaccharide deacetylase family protein [Spirochaetota bacterium]
MIKTRGKKKNYLIIFVILILAALIGFILFRQPPRKVPPPPVAEKAKPEVKKEEYRIAVIIDDVGYVSENLEGYLNFGDRLTFSVLPFLSKSRTYAELLHKKGFEIMIHIPMEPISYPETDPGPYAILTEDTKPDISYKLQLMIDDNPFAKGANNHMGSRTTQDSDVMRYTLNILKNEGFFWIDSYTTGESFGYRLSKELSVPAVKRDVFLDNEDSFSYINAQFEQLKMIAKQQGSAVGIGHFSKKNTLEVLRYQLPGLKKENYRLIYASEAIRN